jgi:DNA-binding MarR family transcriptional regulator
LARTVTEETAHGGQPSVAARGRVSYTLVQVAKMHKAYCAVLLREIGLYPGQELLLMQLWDRDSQTQADLVRALRLDASTVTRMVGRLEQQDIIRRRASPKDGRAVIISLTARGKRLRGKVERVWQELEDATVREMSPRQRQEFLRGLRRIAAALADHPA